MLFITDQEVLDLINWDIVYEAVECSMESVALKKVIQSARLSVSVGDTRLLTMPGYLNSQKFGALACKLVVGNKENPNRTPPIPAINAIIVYFDEETGMIKSIMEANEITKWRTAAASAVATKLIFANLQTSDRILAILGTGEQGVSHARCFFYLFKFKEVFLWNSQKQKALEVAKKLNEEFSTTAFRGNDNIEESVENADVIVTATHASHPILKYEWLKEGAHVNAIGTGGNHCSELEPEIYQKSDVYIDSQEGAQKELQYLLELGIKFKATVGDVIKSSQTHASSKRSKKHTVFQSLGMSVQDCAMARLVYDLYMKQQATQTAK